MEIVDNKLNTINDNVHQNAFHAAFLGLTGRRERRKGLLLSDAYGAQVCGARGFAELRTEAAPTRRRGELSAERLQVVPMRMDKSKRGRCIERTPAMHRSAVTPSEMQRENATVSGAWPPRPNKKKN